MCGDGAARIAVAGAGGVAAGGPVAVGDDGSTSSSYLFRSQSCVRSWPVQTPNYCSSDCSGRAGFADSTGDCGCAAAYYLLPPSSMHLLLALLWTRHRIAERILLLQAFVVVVVDGD